jgi:N-acetylmuramoyl-L-alanine amidase
MRPGFPLAAVLSLCAVCTGPLVPRAWAEVGATGTRLAIDGGAPRAYMTYGHADEPELYAPIVKDLARLQILFVRQADDVIVTQKGKEVARWPIVFSREDVPETGEPCVLVLGGSAYVPVRALSQLCGFEVKWDKEENLMSLAPNTAGAVAVQPNTTPPSDQHQGIVFLTSVVVEQKGSQVEVRVQSSGRVRPVKTMVNSPAPRRLVLDFPNAKWAEGIQMPAGIGAVRAIRIGHPHPDTARLVLEVPSSAVNLIALAVKLDEVVASVGAGKAVVFTKTPVLTSGQIAAIRRRGSPLGRQMASRHATGLLGPPSTLEGDPRNVPGSEVPIDPTIIEPPVGPGTGPGLPHVPRIDPSGALAGRIICVDAGHGGHSSGARGLLHLEKDLCLKMARQLRDGLEAQGARVVMTRDADVYVGLEERCVIANRSGADLFISIHCNSMPRRNMQSGTETYYHTGQSYRLAQSLHGRVVGAVGGRNGGIRNRRFYVIRNTAMPSVLLEIAYINNTLDEQLLAAEEFHGNLAASLTQGVLDYFGK